MHPLRWTGRRLARWLSEPRDGTHAGTSGAGRMVRTLRKGDVLLAISTSGNAANVCRAAEAARAAGLWTVALTGGTGGQLAALADEKLCVASTRVTARIQEGHGMIIHALCELLEDALAE